ncbi:MAG TPA: acyl-CoA dehydrogenase family protein [Acidimicrobiia bacterium]|nr:acyl-CoA dehydrogenase family protein [Acidimicrobiia bacterium]
MLRSSVRAFLPAKAPLAWVRAEYAADASDRSVWDGLAGLGVVGLLVGEEHGGAGMGMVDAAVVLEELGRAVCPVPYVSSAIGAVALADAELRPSLADGSAIGTLAIFEAGARYDWRAPATTAARAGDGFRLDGDKIHVADAGSADVVLVTALDDDGRLGVFATEQFEVEATPTVDGSRKQGRVALRGAAARRVDDGNAEISVARTLDRIGVAAVVDGVGAAQRALELSVEYAKEREQFDKPIGAFQAIQHLCADMLRTVELGRAAGYYACWAIDDASPEEAHRASTLARAFAADAFPQVGGTAIQVFGGIGFTWEHDIHLYYKRLLTVAQALGTASDHLEELATIAID